MTNIFADVVFSNSYLTANQSIAVSSNIGFNVIVVRPGGKYNWEADASKIRICSVASGKLKVKIGDLDFVIGPNGMFKIKVGTACEVQNRLYIDAVLHVSTYDGD
jgi:mannose-6-phosphate isomerase-like protein (cupin superfamily)